MYRTLALFICAVWMITTASAQAESNKQKELFHNYSKLLSPEKVYLHTDKDVYFATDTIWFSGYVENASYASEFDESNYIYVELITDQLQRKESSFSEYAEYKNSVSVRKKIRREGNVFQGHIVVPEMNSTGRGVIRAYTYWMMNRPPEYMFYKELELVNPMKDKLVAAMVEKDIKDRKEYLRMGEIMPEDKPMGNAKGKKAEVKERYDVQFLPESGRLIKGTRAVVYVKAVGTGGMGAQVNGAVYDAAGEEIAIYSTDSLGFGRFELANVPAEGVYASVMDLTGYKKGSLKFPEVEETGVAINGSFAVRGKDGYGDKDMVRFSITASETLLGRGLQVYLSNGSEIYFSAPINRGQEMVSFFLNGLTPGIHAVTVVDNQGNVYAQRPFAILPPKGEKEVAMDVSKQRYGKRELVDVKVTIPEDMLDSTANFSVAVTDMGLADNIEKTTLKSYMLLKSELQGYIENIDWYFNDTIPLAARMHRVDMLMQTQGWRYYDLGEIVQGRSPMPGFGREYSQTLFGRVVNMMGLAKNSTVTFMAPSIGFQAMGQVDSGYFVLQNISFPEDTRFIVGAVDKKGRTMRQTPELFKDYFAPEYKYPTRGEKVVYSAMVNRVVEDIYYGKDDIEHAMAFDLDPVVIKSLTFRPKNTPSPIFNYPLRKDWYRDTLDMKAYAMNYDIGSYVTAAYPGVRQFLGGPIDEIALPKYLQAQNNDAMGGVKDEEIPSGSLIGSYLSAGSMTGGESGVVAGRPKRSAVVLVYLNGVFIYPEEAVHTVLTLPLSDVESIVYVSGVSASPFQPAFSNGDISPFPILMVRTKPRVRTDAVPYNISFGYPLGWQKPARFYSPKYDTPESKKSKAKDNRITLYWNPAVKLDENGEATISFYTSDSDSQYRIEVEGRSAARQYHYAEKIIERKVENQNGKKK